MGIIFRKTVGEHAARTSGADNNIVCLFHWDQPLGNFARVYCNVAYLAADGLSSASRLARANHSSILTGMQGRRALCS